MTSIDQIFANSEASVKYGYLPNVLAKASLCSDKNSEYTLAVFLKLSKL